MGKRKRGKVFKYTENKETTADEEANPFESHFRNNARWKKEEEEVEFNTVKD